jgi:hypothetical protein
MLDIQAMACDRYKRVAGLKLHIFASTKKTHIVSQKKENNINMTSTIAGSMKARSSLTVT